MKTINRVEVSWGKFGGIKFDVFHNESLTPDKLTFNNSDAASRWLEEGALRPATSDEMKQYGYGVLQTLITNPSFWIYIPVTPTILNLTSPHPVLTHKESGGDDLCDGDCIDYLLQLVRDPSRTLPNTELKQLERFLTKLKLDKWGANRPTRVCLCGSTRFSDAYQQANLNETLLGNIVLTIGCDMKSDAHLFTNKSLDELTSIKQKLDELHLRKIDLADEVLILNVDGYIGESTWREILYARDHGKIIRWWEPEKAPFKS